MSHTISILHISDLHERAALSWMPLERQNRIRYGAAKRYRVLGPEFSDIISDVLSLGPLHIVCFTGDVADWGLAEEYNSAADRMTRVIQALRLSPKAFYAVPGNHDVTRSINSDSWARIRPLAQRSLDSLSEWMANAGPPPAGVDPRDRTRVLERSGEFWRWLSTLRADELLLPQNSPHGSLGYQVATGITPFSFPVHVIGLDSSWLAGDDHDSGKLALGDGQLNMLCSDSEGRNLQGLRIGLVHHPLEHLVDNHQAFQLLAPKLDLLLHGHQHEPLVAFRASPDRKLLVVAAGSLYEGDSGDKWLNSFQRIDINVNDDGRPIEYLLTSYGWSQQGFWHRSGAIYKAARQGQLRWRIGPSNFTPIDDNCAIDESRQTATPPSATQKSAAHESIPGKPERTSRSLGLLILAAIALILSLVFFVFREHFTPSEARPSASAAKEGAISVSPHTRKLSKSSGIESFSILIDNKGDTDFENRGLLLEVAPPLTNDEALQVASLSSFDTLTKLGPGGSVLSFDKRSLTPRWHSGTSTFVLAQLGHISGGQSLSLKVDVNGAHVVDGSLLTARLVDLEEYRNRVVDMEKVSNLVIAQLASFSERQPQAAEFAAFLRTPRPPYGALGFVWQPEPWPINAPGPFTILAPVNEAGYFLHILRDSDKSLVAHWRSPKFTGGTLRFAHKSSLSEQSHRIVLAWGVAGAGLYVDDSLVDTIGTFYESLGVSNTPRPSQSPVMAFDTATSTHYVAWNEQTLTSGMRVYFSKSVDDSRTFSASADLGPSWNANNSAPLLGVEPGGRLVMLETLRPGESWLRTRFSTDQGKSFSAPQSFETPIPFTLGRNAVWCIDRSLLYLAGPDPAGRALHLYVSRDYGRQWKSVTAIPLGARAHGSISLAQSYPKVAVAWEQASSANRIDVMARIFSCDADKCVATSQSISPSTKLPTGGSLPRIIALGEDFLVIWVTDDRTYAALTTDQGRDFSVPTELKDIRLTEFREGDVLVTVARFRNADSSPCLDPSYYFGLSNRMARMKSPDGITSVLLGPLGQFSPDGSGAIRFVYDDAGEVFIGKCK